MPILDNHLHLQPQGGGVEAMREFEKAGGTHAILSNLPYKGIKIKTGSDFLRQYEVTLDLRASISGEFAEGPDGPTLAMSIYMSGEQLVEVEADRFQGEYPWSGEVSLDLSFPVTDGATAQGEGWVLMLHLDSL